DIGEKLHLFDLDAVAFASFAATARHVEAEMRRVEAARLGLASRSEEIANRVVDFDVSHRVRARRAAYRRLIDQNDVIQILRAVDLAERADRSGPLAPLFLDSGIYDIVHQGRLARAGNPCNANHHPERKLDVDALEVVLARTAHLECS